MSVTSTEMSTVLQGLVQVLDESRRPGVIAGKWRWSVRRQMAAVRDALAAESGAAREGAFAAREAGLVRERDALLGRLGTLGARVLVDPDVDGLRRQLHRLVTDISHHVQRQHDLTYDELELDLGGSE